MSAPPIHTRFRNQTSKRSHCSTVRYMLLKFIPTVPHPPWDPSIFSRPRPFQLPRHTCCYLPSLPETLFPLSVSFPVSQPIPTVALTRTRHRALHEFACHSVSEAMLISASFPLRFMCCQREHTSSSPGRTDDSNLQSGLIIFTPNTTSDSPFRPTTPKPSSTRRLESGGS